MEKKQAIFALNVPISQKRLEIRSVTINESHMWFRLAPRSMTLDDLELLKVRIFGEFRRFGTQQQLND